MPIERINQLIVDGFEKAKKSEDGSIPRKESIKILQNIFKNEIGMFGVKTSNKDNYFEKAEGFVSMHEIDSGASFGYGYGFGYGFGFDGLLSQYKDLFDLYMDEDTDGGKNITKEEQKEIKETVENWSKKWNNIKNYDIKEEPNKPEYFIDLNVKNYERYTIYKGIFNKPTKPKLHH